MNCSKSKLARQTFWDLWLWHVINQFDNDEVLMLNITYYFDWKQIQQLKTEKTNFYWFKLTNKTFFLSVLCSWKKNVKYISCNKYWIFIIQTSANQIGWWHAKDITVLCISVRTRPKRLETRVIIKISTHPCYPRTFDYFSWD